MKRILLMLLLFSISGGAKAHEVRPALLEIVRDSAQICQISWKQPTAGEIAVRLVPHLSGGWIEGLPERDLITPGHRVMRWSKSNCTIAALEAQLFTVAGLEATITDVLVRIDYGDGETRQHILRPGDQPLTLARMAAHSHASSAYFILGAEHIFEGIDHLAFVLGLVLLVGFRVRLLTAVTGFTVAHSLTLAVTALGILKPRPALIEALVALSIIFIATEVLRAKEGKSSLTIRWPELAALGFGLLHGFAFAGALIDIGLPRNDTLLALLLFNLGVEAGQLLFIAALLGISFAARPQLARLPRWTPNVPPYAIGIAASYWFIERITAL